MNQMKVNDKYAIRYHRLKTGWEWQYWNNSVWQHLASTLYNNDSAKSLASELYPCKLSEVKIIKRKMKNKP